MGPLAYISPAPAPVRVGPVVYQRSPGGYGWSVTVGKRLRWNSRKATSRMLPRISLGADEHCNRAVSVILWPVGHLDVWWEPVWRTRTCDPCRAEHRAAGLCEDCGSRPCGCPTPQTQDL
jgi:hypothetical protein